LKAHGGVIVNSRPRPGGGGAARFYTTQWDYIGDVADDVSLMGEGIMDSTGVLELILFVEETFALSVADDEILPENFDSVARIAAYVERKGGPGLVEAAS
jgi:acyl carrier protein